MDNRTVTAIEAIRLKKHFKASGSFLRPWQKREKTEVLKEIDFKISPGEIVGLLGPNGAGKTTLLRILATSILPTCGEAYVRGYSVLREGREVRNCTGFITGEERSFYWRLSGRENLEFFGRLYGISGLYLKKRIEEFIELLKIKHPDRRCGLYSAGNMQRLAIARALLNDPVVLLMDEPFKGLDPLFIENLKDFLNRFVKSSNKTILLATHNLEGMKDFCERAIIIKDGRIAGIHSVRDDIRNIYRHYFDKN